MHTVQRGEKPCTTNHEPRRKFVKIRLSLYKFGVYFCLCVGLSVCPQFSFTLFFCPINPLWIEIQVFFATLTQKKNLVNAKGL